MKPIIGVTSQYGYEPGKDLNKINYTYIDAITKAGGVPVIIPILKERDDISRYIDIIEGIIFTGGEDISPLLFNEEPIKETQIIYHDRDEMEIVLFKEAYERNLSILGICRGIQLLNIALGGTLYQDINTQIPDSLGHISTYNIEGGYHSISIKEGTILNNIFEKRKIIVNSQHHQSIKDLGKNLRINAVSSDGIIEGVESTNDKFLLGVQFHPEAMINRHKEFLNIFTYFIKSCK